MRQLPFVESLEQRQLLSASPLVAKGVRVTAVEGHAFSQVSVATLKDKTPEAAGAYAATITWGDGNSSAGVVVSDGSGGFVVDGSHTYVARGKYKTTIAVTETDGNAAHAASSAKVNNAAIGVTGKNASGIAGLAISGVVASYTDADPRSASGPVAGQTALIRWGDGTTSAGTLTLNTATRHIDVSGKHAYVKAGTFTISTLIREPGVPPTIGTSTATVAAPSPVLTPSFVGDFVGTAKSGGNGLFDGLIGDVVGAQPFEFNVSSQEIDTLTATVTLAGAEFTGDFGGSLLNNRKFDFSISNTEGSVDISGRFSADGSIITGSITAQYAGLDHKFKGDFSATRQTG